MKQRGAVKLDGKVWRLQLRVRKPEGGFRWSSIRLGTKAELPSKAAARAAADRYLNHTDTRAIEPGASMEWSAWCDRFIDYYLGFQAKATRRTKGSIIEAHLRQAFEGPVHEIDKARIQAFLVAQRNSGAAPTTVNARFATLRRMLRAAAKEGLAVTPPTLSQLDLPKQEEVTGEVRKKAFTQDEFDRILAASTLQDATAYALGRYLGLRGSEIVGLEWSLIDLSTGAVTIRQQALDGVRRPLKSKGSAAVLQAPVELLERLREYRETFEPGYDGFLFTDAAMRAQTAQVLRERLHATLATLGIPRRGLHGLRHLCALSMAAAGVNPETIRRAMRHSSLEVTALYLTVSAEDIAAGLVRGATGSKATGA